MKKEDRELHSMLEVIRSGSADSALDALFHLQIKICPQGVAVSRETARVLPVLIDVAANSESKVRLESLRLIIRISRASHVWRNSARRAQPEYFGNYVEKIEWETAVDRIFDDATPCLAHLAFDDDPAIAAMARDLKALP
ncbi:hypothetical protein ACGFJT_39685 [Actinomadura geliboluensis]|uniref:hypothetical protein n=1 Tax=Actinomadura geliboluensis TaxID=882440 RepID=UPI00372428BD